MNLSRKLLCIATSFAFMGGATAMDLHEDDQRFLRKAAESGMLEIQASQLAIQKAEHAEVRSYAEMMVKDHSAADKELKSLADRKGFVLPVELEGDKLDLLNKLRELSGHDFEEEYVEEVAVDAHEEAVDLFEDAADDAKDPEVKAFAAKLLPKLQQHLEMGEKLDDKLDDLHDRDKRDSGKRDARRDAATTPTPGQQEGAVVIPGTGTQPAQR